MAGRSAFGGDVSGVVAATLERESGELRVQRLPGGSDAVVEFVAGLSGSVRATYEAGPSGLCSLASWLRSASTAWSARRG